MSNTSLPWLAPLWRFRPKGCGEVRELTGEAVPEPFRRLLVHAGDMTSRLEAFHADRITLEVLQRLSDGEGTLLREVLLRRVSDRRAVEYGAIEIRLDIFADSVRAEILDGKEPLGGLLNRHGVSYFSEPGAFFAITPDPVLCALLSAPESQELFGRGNVLRRGDGALIARIVEVLPPEEREFLEKRAFA